MDNSDTQKRAFKVQTLSNQIYLFETDANVFVILFRTKYLLLKNLFLKGLLFQPIDKSLYLILKYLMMKSSLELIVRSLLFS